MELPRYFLETSELENVNSSTKFAIEYQRNDSKGVFTVICNLSDFHQLLKALDSAGFFNFKLKAKIKNKWQFLTLTQQKTL